MALGLKEMGTGKRLALSEVGPLILLIVSPVTLKYKPEPFPMVL